MSIIVDEKYRGKKEFYEVYCKLIETAKQEAIICYGKDIATIMNLPTQGEHMAREVGQILGEISECEHNNKRPLLSSVVVREDTKSPGEGFFKLARQLGKLEPNQDKATFWQNELQDVYNTWRER